MIQCRSDTVDHPSGQPRPDHGTSRVGIHKQPTVKKTGWSSYCAMDSSDAGDELERLLDACDSITATALSCRVEGAAISTDSSFGSASLEEQILREQEISRWLDQKNFDQERIRRLFEGAPASASSVAPEEARKHLLQTSAQLQLDYIYLTRLNMARAFEECSEPTEFSAWDQDFREMVMEAVRQRNQLVERIIYDGRRLSSLRERVKNVQDQVYKLQNDSQSQYYGMKRREETVRTMKGKDVDRLQATNDEGVDRIRRRKNDIMDRVITDILAACDERVTSHDHVQKIIIDRINKK